MQFIENGPDIPDSLLQAHEEGRVIFFCGAGVSYPAGLPGFRGLVEKFIKKMEQNSQMLRRTLLIEVSLIPHLICSNVVCQGSV